MQTALGLVASGVGICVVPGSVRRFGRNDVHFLDLDETFSSPIIISYRKNKYSVLLKQFHRPSRPRSLMRLHGQYAFPRLISTTPSARMLRLFNGRPFFNRGVEVNS